MKESNKNFFAEVFKATDPHEDITREERERLENLERGIRKKLSEKLGGMEKIMADKRLAAFYNTILYLVIRAREAANTEADSWRNFNVGCAVAGYKESLAGSRHSPYPIYTGSNTKPEEVGPKICAEQIGIGAAIHDHIDKIRTSVTGFVVSGNPQKDEKTGLMPHTLHPCENCRKLLTKMLKKNGDKLENVILVTVGLDNDNFEVFSWDELLRLYEDK